MHWHPIEPDQLPRSPLATHALDVWWWPEAIYPTLADRRQRTDAILRRLLAPYLALSPDALCFGREQHGRPFLRHEHAPDFNLSDTAGGTAVVIAAHGRVGVDIERTDRAPLVQRLAERWFAPEEARCLQAMAAEPARRAFLTLWTAKEAACKATGTGIFGFLPVWRFGVDDDFLPPQLVSLPGDAGAPARWRFHRLAPTPAHTLVVACRDLDARPRAFIVVK